LVKERAIAKMDGLTPEIIGHILQYLLAPGDLLTARLINSVWWKEANRELKRRMAKGKEIRSCTDEYYHLTKTFKWYNFKSDVNKSGKRLALAPNSAMLKMQDEINYGMFGEKYRAWRKMLGPLAGSNTSRIKRRVDALWMKMAKEDMPNLLYPDRFSPIGKCFLTIRENNVTTAAYNGGRSWDGPDSSTLVSGGRAYCLDMEYDRAYILVISPDDTKPNRLRVSMGNTHVFLPNADEVMAVGIVSHHATHLVEIVTRWESDCLADLPLLYAVHLISVPSLTLLGTRRCDRLLRCSAWCRPGLMDQLTLFFDMSFDGCCGSCNFLPQTGEVVAYALFAPRDISSSNSFSQPLLKVKRFFHILYQRPIFHWKMGFITLLYSYPPSLPLFKREQTRQ
jgi:hypothetical protein